MQHAHQLGTGGGLPLPPRRLDLLLERVQQIVPYIAIEVTLNMFFIFYLMFIFIMYNVHVCSINYRGLLG
jgi:hypothetical protein